MVMVTFVPSLWVMVVGTRLAGTANADAAPKRQAAIRMITFLIYNDLGLLFVVAYFFRAAMEASIAAMRVSGMKETDIHGKHLRL